MGNFFFVYEVTESLADPQGAAGVPPPPAPSGTRFFHFYVCAQKRLRRTSASPPPTGRHLPQTGNSGCATGSCYITRLYHFMEDRNLFYQIKFKLNDFSKTFLRFLIKFHKYKENIILLKSVRLLNLHRACHYPDRFCL